MAKQKDNSDPLDTVPGYAVEVEGQYYSRDVNTGLKNQKFYKKEKFFFPKIVTFVEGKKKIERIIDGTAKTVWVPNVKRANALKVCLHLIKNFHIDDRLREKYPDFMGTRSIEIFSKEEVDISEDVGLDFAKKVIKDMTKSELAQTIAINDLNITLKNYIDLGDMKIAVSKALKKRDADDKAAGKTAGMTEEEKLLLEPESSSLFG